jgi:hypothetical protein
LNKKMKKKCMYIPPRTEIVFVEQMGLLSNSAHVTSSNVVLDDESDYDERNIDGGEYETE